jgi:phosphoribosyl-dephospho-CoA transferase
MPRPSRISRTVILAQLRLAATKGDRAALTLAVDQMKTWAYSPRYWQKYMQLLAHPLARLMDLAVIKQGDKIAHQKGWVKPPRPPRKPKREARPRPAGRPRRSPRAAPSTSTQPSLFPEL